MVEALNVRQPRRHNNGFMKPNHLMSRWMSVADVAEYLELAIADVGTL